MSGQKILESNETNGSMKDSSSNSHQINLPFTALQSLSKQSDQVVHAVLIELGSNNHADRHLKQAREELELVSDCAIWSSEFVNQDYTATPDNPKPDYTNQCGFLILNTQKFINVYDLVDDAIKLGEFVKTTKVLEKRIQNDCYAAELISKLDTEVFINHIKAPKVRQVIIDIDVLAFQGEDNRLTAILERYPFKHHEWVGIKELIKAQAFV